MSIKLITICLSSALILISCSPKQETEDVANNNPYWLLPPTFEKINESFSLDLSIDDIPEPEKCLESKDINGSECTEEMWKANLDNICNAEQINVEFAKMCVWRQFEHCEFPRDRMRNWFNDSEVEMEVEQFIEKADLYGCTNYLMLEEIRKTSENISDDLYSLYDLLNP